jgi:hypothetical protein
MILLGVQLIPEFVQSPRLRGAPNTRQHLIAVDNDARIRLNPQTAFASRSVPVCRIGTYVDHENVDLTARQRRVTDCDSLVRASR